MFLLIKFCDSCQRFCIRSCHLVKWFSYQLRNRLRWGFHVNNDTFPVRIERSLTEIVVRFTHLSRLFLAWSFATPLLCTFLQWLVKRQLRAGQPLQNLSLNWQRSNGKFVQGAAGQTASADCSSHSKSSNGFRLEIQAPKRSSLYKEIGWLYTMETPQYLYEKSYFNKQNTACSF